MQPCGKPILGLNFGVNKFINRAFQLSLNHPTTAMNTQSDRRQFLKTSAAVGAGIAAIDGFPSLHAADASKKLVVGIVGLGRGMGHVSGHLADSYTEVAYVCDLDPKRAEAGAAAAEKRQNKRPKAVKDFRAILDDKDVDAVSFALPNFWHTPAAIMAMKAGKHVYVEKPGSHNPHEGELIVAAQKKYGKVVQMGNQRRSYPHLIEAIERLRAGDIGKVLSSRTYYNADRQTIGHGKQVPPPEWLDYAMWQGPTPERPFVDNLLHYNWHWRWHYGGGELANNGIHGLDISRWGLGVEYPKRVTFNGGRYHFEDDQETPDTGAAVFDFGTCAAIWDDSSCNPRKGEKTPFISFYGEKGSLLNFGKNDYTLCDLNGKELEKKSDPPSDNPHFANFHDAIRDGKKLNSPIDEGQKSTLLCHLGNIAYRTGHTINFDPVNRKIIGDAEADKLWAREYRPGWEPTV
jgi:predicted dehydrogenase